MVIYFNLGSTIVAGGLYVEHIAFVPICIVNLIELFGTWIEEIFGVHYVSQEGIHLYVGWEVYYLHLDDL